MPTIPTDPLFSFQWYLRNLTAGLLDINVIDVWDDYTGNGVQVTVIDQGFDLYHTDLVGKFRTDLDMDYPGVSFDPNETGTDRHGTPVSGIIGAEEGNGIGGVGIAWDAEIVAYKGLGSGYLDAAGLGDGYYNDSGNDNGSDVINGSFGRSSNFVTSGKVLEINAIVDHGRGGLGTNFVKSNGNARDTYPATATQIGMEGTAVLENSLQGTLNVAALRADGWVARYSSPGANLLVSAFADDITDVKGIYTTDRSGVDGYNIDINDNGGDYTNFNGTSASAPIVAGVVALIMEANPDLGWRDVQEILAYSARHVGSAVDSAANTGAPTNGSVNRGYEIATQSNGSTWFWNDARDWNGGSMHFSNDYGYGLVDAKAAIRLAETWDRQSTTENQLSFELDINGAGSTSIGNSVTSFSTSLDEDIIIEYVSVNLKFHVDNINDMSVFLVSPDGTRVQLIHYVDGAQGTNVFDPSQAGLDGWEFGTTAFMGTVNEGASRPAITGDWTLELSNIDGSAQGIFFVTDADVTFKGRPVEEDNLYVFTNEYSDFVGDGEHTALFVNGTAGGTTGTFNAAAVTSATTLDFVANTGVIDGVAIQVYAIDEVYTGDGNDTIIGDTSSTLFFTGRGNDSITGATASAFGELINGGRGNDYISAGGGDDVIIDGVFGHSEGNDTIEGGLGDDLIIVHYVTAGTYSGDLGNDTLDLRNDTINFDFLQTIDLSAASFTAYSGTFAGFENALLGDGNDRIVGSMDANYLVAGKGDDTVLGGAGADKIEGDEIPFGLLAMNENGVTDQYVEVANFDEMPTENFTVEWLYRGDGLGMATEVPFVSYGVPGETNEFLVLGQLPTTISVWVNDQYFDTGVLTSLVTDGQVHRMSVSVNTGAGPNGRISLYIDGVEASRGFGLSSGPQTASGTAIEAGGSFIMGQEQDGAIPGDASTFSATQRLIGEIGDVRIWNTERFASDIAKLAFERLETLDLRDQRSLVANWQLDAETLSFDNIAGTAALTPKSATATPFEGDLYTRFGGDDSLSGEAGNDSINGGGGNDTILGGDGVDTLKGGSGNDRIDGGSDSDLIYAGSGNDIIVATGADFVDSVHGGDGNDTLDHTGLFGSFTGATLDFEQGFIFTDRATNAATTVSGIERYNDNFGSNTIIMGGGLTYVVGGSGNDTIVGSLLADTILGGFGNDSLQGQFGGDLIDGGSGNDTLGTNGSFDNTLRGGTGDDVIEVIGGGINEGGAGADTFVVRSQSLIGDADTLDNDIFDGGDDIDTFDASNELINGFVINLASGLVDSGNAGGGHTVGIQNVENATGTNQLDVLTGDGIANVLLGLAGDDIIDGGAGNDTIAGGAGNDSLLAGADDDQATGGTGNDTLYGFGGNDTLAGNDGNDAVRGNLGDDLVSGEAGNDTVIGGAGNDIIYGGAGNDLVSGGTGNDLLNGGTGFDTGDYSYVTDNLVINLKFTTGQNISTLAGTDTLYSVEGILGGSGNDLLVGDAAGNIFEGRGGNDQVYGAGGRDILHGGDGVDLVEGSGGNDIMTGGAGIDVLSYYNSAGGVQVNLRFQGTAQAVGGSSGTDTFTEFEDLYGSNAGGDTLVGSTEDNRILGYAGNDLIYGFDGADNLFGMAGNDTLSGGEGVDVLTGGGGADTFDFNNVSDSTSTQRDTIMDFGTGGANLIDLSTIDANSSIAGNQAFSFVGSSAFSSAGQIRFATNGTNGFVLGDIDGDSTADLNILLMGITSVNLSDFVF
jgi:Ca2+-binding RTX toxin-like protein